MANPFSKAMMMARYVGKTYGKVKVLNFVRQQKSEEMRQAVWFVKALCGYCGKEYECRFDSVRYRTNPHCGCQSKRSMWNRTSEIKRQEGSVADKRRKARQKAEQAAKVEQELRKKEKARHEAEVRRGLTSTKSQVERCPLVMALNSPKVDSARFGKRCPKTSAVSLGKNLKPYPVGIA